MPGTRPPRRAHSSGSVACEIQRILVVISRTYDKNYIFYSKGIGICVAVHNELSLLVVIYCLFQTNDNKTQTAEWLTARFT